MNQIDQVTEVQECKDKGGESYPDILDKVKEVLGRWYRNLEHGIKLMNEL